MASPEKHQTPFIIMAGLALLGVLLMLSLTRWGVGLSPDSVSYIGGARSLVQGEGLRNGFGEDVGEPMTFRAPLYSVLLAGLAKAGLEAVSAARWLNALFFGANIFLVGVLIYSVTRHDRWLPIVGSLLVLLSLVMLTIHAFAWTEPLFILLGFSGFLLLASYLQNERFVLLMLAGVLMGLAVLTRYAGLPLLAAAGLGVLLFSQKGYGRRLVDALLFGIVGILPFAVWTGRNMLVAGNSSGRAFVFHPIGMTQIWQAVFTMTNWMQLPAVVPGIVRILILVMFAVGLLVLIYWAYESGEVAEASATAVPYLIKLLLLFILVYFAFLVVSISFLDANTPLDDRILSPVFVAWVVIIAWTISILWQRTRRKTLLAGVVLAALGLFVITAVINNVRWGLPIYQNGSGFSHKDWQSSATLDEVKRLPADTPIYSNVPEVIYLYTNQPALALPRPYNVATQQTDDNYDQKLADVQQQLSQNSGVIVFFDTLRPDALEIVNDVAQQLPLTTLTQTADGTIFTVDTK